MTSGTRSFFELFNTIGRLRRDAAWALEAPRYLLELIRVWVQKYEAGAFDEDAATADLLQEYEARTDAGYRNFYSDLNLAAAHALKGDIDQAKAPLGARFNERVEQAAGRRPQTAERLFLQPVADGPRQEILREGGGRIGPNRLRPATPQLVDVHLAYRTKP